MSTTAYVTTPSEGVNFNLTYTTGTATPEYPGLPFSVGTTMAGTNGSAFIFAKASADITAGDVCQISTTFTAAGITTGTATVGSLVGVAPVSIASGAYGWLQRAGQCSGINCAAVVANAVLYTTGTAGQVDDATTTKITGIVSNVSAGPAVQAGTLNYPVVG